MNTRSRLFWFWLPFLWVSIAQADDLRDLIAGFKPNAEEQQAGAAVVRYEVRGELKSPTDWVETSRIVVAVLDQQAASDYSRIRVSFNNFYDSLELVSARLIDVDGQERRPSADAVQYKTADNGVAYDDQRTLTFSMPAVAPGTFLEYRLKVTRRKPVIPGYWYQTHWLSLVQEVAGRVRIDPVRESSLHLRVPAGMPLKIGGKGNRYQQSDRARGGVRELVWQAKGLKQFDPEPGMPSFSEHVNQLEFSSIPQWSKIDHWATGVYTKAATPNSRIEALVNQIVTPNMNRRERVEALFYWVQQQVRYIGADFKRGGIVPHGAGEVLSNRYGDCKDQSVLLIAMLKAAGVPAEPVLINLATARKVNPDVPSLRFNHMIVRVKLDGKDVFLDTSGDAGPFPGADVSLAEQRAFVITGKGGELKQLPALEPEQNQLRMHIAFSFDGEDVRAKLQVRTKGSFDHRYRTALHQQPEFKDKLRDLLAKSYSTATRIEHFYINEVAGSSDPLSFGGELVFEGLWQSSHREEYLCAGDMSTILGLFSHLMGLPQEDRQFDFESGVPSQFFLVTECPAPGDDYRPRMLTGNANIQNDAFVYQRKVSEAPGRVTIDQRFTLFGKTIPAKAYRRFTRDVRSAITQSSWRYLYQQDAEYGATLALQKKLQRNEADFASRIELARKLMAEADYAGARAMVEQVLVKQPKNGEAQYVLGLVLGFMDEFDASDAALKKASNLGYRP